MTVQKLAVLAVGLPEEAHVLIKSADPKEAYEEAKTLASLATGEKKNSMLSGLLDTGKGVDLEGIMAKMAEKAKTGE